MAKRTIFYDTETTGVKPGRDRVIEIAAYDPGSEPGQEKKFCTLTYPEMPIPGESSAISGITD
ncbi:MAG TPA: exonuclease domain-containing protein, partial [Chlamydiales bacterium]|nr:exonuclease domain-containing protein [Chlamydiales bacterium]